jgi:hypothetical protein
MKRDEGGCDYKRPPNLRLDGSASGAKCWGFASLTANLQMPNYRAQKLGLSTQPTVLKYTLYLRSAAKQENA